MADMHEESNKKEVMDQRIKTVPFYKLFSFADSLDYFLMIVGTVSAVANGVSTPLMTIIIGDAVDAFGGNANNKQVVHQVSKVSFGVYFKFFDFHVIIHHGFVHFMFSGVSQLCNHGCMRLFSSVSA